MAAAIGLLLAPLLAVPPWRLVEARLFDILSTLSPIQPPRPGATIVAVDEPSFAEIGRQWPWPRDLHARLIRSLREAGAKVIAFDVIFAEPSAPEADAALIEATAPDLVYAADFAVIPSPQAEHTVRVEPMLELLERGGAAGLSSVVLDGDGTLRRLPPYQDGFAARILALEHGAPVAPPPQQALIQYFGPPRTYPTVSYYQALAPEEFLPRGIFRDRTVIVGLSLQNAPRPVSGAADAFATSYTVWTGQFTAGPEIQAIILDNLRHRLFILPAPLWAQLAALAAAALAGAVVACRCLAWRRALSAAALAALAVALSWLLLTEARIWLPPALPAVAVIGVAGAQGALDFAHERRLRREVSRAFAHYLAPELVARLARDPTALKIGGERRTLSLLFCDVRGFTTLSERMKDDPERLTRLVNRLLNPLSEAVLSECGTIDKYIGDCIMAFWNAPLDDPDHARHAVAAALGILRAIDRLNEELAAEADGTPALRLAVGIGINTGECVVGNMGSDHRFDYSALGDAVNLASRLEGASKQYRVPLLIGPETRDRVEQDYVTLELDRIAVKGRATAVAVSTVLGPAERFCEAEISALICEHQAFLDRYRGRDWDKAEQSALRCLAVSPDLSGYYGMMLKRIEAFRMAPPPPDWDGTFAASEK